MKTEVFHSKLKSVMTDNKFDRRVPGQRKGKLDTNRLWRAKMGSEAVFRQKKARKGKDYSVLILIDQSGSMYHDQTYLPSFFKGNNEFYDRSIGKSARLAYDLAKGFEASGISFAVQGFNCELNDVLPFGQKIASQEDFEWEIIRKSWITNEQEEEITKQGKANPIAGNHDHDALKRAIDTVSQKKGEKIIIVFSDGSPRCDHPGLCKYDQEKHTISRIRTLVQSREDIKIVGFGLGDNTVQEIYPQSIIINSLEEFRPKVIGYFSKAIKRF